MSQALSIFLNRIQSAIHWVPVRNIEIPCSLRKCNIWRLVDMIIPGGVGIVLLRRHGKFISDACKKIIVMFHSSVWLVPIQASSLYIITRDHCANLLSSILIKNYLNYFRHFQTLQTLFLFNTKRSFYFFLLIHYLLLTCLRLLWFVDKVFIAWNVEQRMMNRILMLLEGP